MTGAHGDFLRLVVPAVSASGTAVPSLFVGVAVRESGLLNFENLRSGTVLYGATFFLGLTLWILCKANTFSAQLS